MNLYKESEFSDKASIGLLLGICILCLALFADKAFHMDDPLFIYTAKHIQTNPFDFYGFTVNWYGYEMPMSEVTKNPPLASYYMALAALLFGWSEIALHLAFLIPASAAVIGTFFLARELCDRPFLAALAGLTTPVFLLSSTTVMCDTLMLSLWVWAVYFWRRGVKRDSIASLAVASVLIAACSLTKYFGLSLIPLLFVYSLAEKRKAGSWMLFLLTPILILAAYQWATQALYGRGLLLDAASYVTVVHEKIGGNFLTKVLTGAAFTGGCLITALLAAPLLWRKKIIAMTVLSAFLLTLAVWYFSAVFTFPAALHADDNWLFLIQFFLFLCSAAFVVILIVADARTGRDTDSLLLFVWMMGTVVFACFLNWTVNGRSILPMAPAFGIMAARRMARMNTAGRDTAHRLFLLPVVLALIISLAVTRADYRLANTARIAALEIHDAFKSDPGSLWFQGHWGFQYYMERLGGKAMDFMQSKVQPGDIVIMPLNNTNLKPLLPDRVLMMREFQFDPGGFLTTMNISAGAGFYMDIRGPMAYALAYDTVEKYGAFRVIR